MFIYCFCLFSSRSYSDNVIFGRILNFSSSFVATGTFRTYFFYFCYSCCLEDFSIFSFSYVFSDFYSTCFSYFYFCTFFLSFCFFSTFSFFYDFSFFSIFCCLGSKSSAVNSNTIGLSTSKQSFYSFLLKVYTFPNFSSIN